MVVIFVFRSSSPFLLSSLPSLPSGLQFLLGAAWAGLALTAVVLLQERRSALADVGWCVRHRVQSLEEDGGIGGVAGSILCSVQSDDAEQKKVVKERTD